MQYRASFVMLSLSQFLVTFLEFGAIVILFDRFRQLRGWTLAEVALFYGIVNAAFAVAEGAARGFDSFDQMVKAGDFDRILLRPRASAFQISATNVALHRVGRLAQGLAILGWAIAKLDLGLASVLLAVLAIAGGACLFSGLFVLHATLAFWSTESLEIINTVTYGGTETAQYPISIYRGWFRRFFTFVVPLACVTYYPALVMLGKAPPSEAWAYALAPGVGVVFLALSLVAWQQGVRHYRSTGS